MDEIPKEFSKLEELESLTLQELQTRIAVLSGLVQNTQNNIDTILQNLKTLEMTSKEMFKVVQKDLSLKSHFESNMKTLWMQRSGLTAELKVHLQTKLDVTNKMERCKLILIEKSGWRPVGDLGWSLWERSIRYENNSENDMETDQVPDKEDI